MESRILICLGALGLFSACATGNPNNAEPSDSDSGDPDSSGAGSESSEGSSGEESSGGATEGASDSADSGTGSTGAEEDECRHECVDQCEAPDMVVMPGSCPGERVCCEAAPATTADSGIADTAESGDETGEGESGTGGETGSDTEDDAPGVAESRENTGLDCTVAQLPAPSDLPLIERLPDPFTKLDGTRMTSKEEWRCRRQELHEQAEKYIYGEKPPKPDSVTGTVTNTEVSVDVEHMGTSIHFSAQIVLPQVGQAPFPAIINLGAKGGFSGIALGEQFILDQGVAIIFYNHYDLGVEGPVEASRGLPNPGLFYDIFGGNHSAGLLMAWAWGASRLIDVLQESGREIIDPARLGVTGCSRNGKGAFTVGVFDERIALTIPHETSTGGVPAYRIVDALSTERTYDNFYGLNWLSNDFEPFVLNAAQLPVDTHEMVAMIAPRGLLVLDNPHVRQYGAPAGHVATLAGAEMFKALGVEANIGYISNVANQSHCAVGKPEYDEPLRQAIAKFLKFEDAAPGQIQAHPNGMGNLAEWRDWETPSLAD